MRSRLRINPCGPLFTNPSGSDDLGGSLGLDPAGVFKGQNPQLNIVAGSMKLSADAKSLAVTLTLNNLSKQLPPGGQANEYYMYWSFGNTKYFTNVEVDATGNVTYSDGTNGTAGRSYRSSADTGSFVPGPRGTVTVNAPILFIGKPKAGEVLSSPNAETRELEGAAAQGIVLPVDTAAAQYDYQMGQVCSAGTNTTPVTPPVVPIGNQLPSTEPRPMMPLAPLALLMAGATAALITRRLGKN
jgi:hypothetical protein